jgi:hypothetical protein
MHVALITDNKANSITEQKTFRVNVDISAKGFELTPQRNLHFEELRTARQFAVEILIEMWKCLQAANWILCNNI